MEDFVNSVDEPNCYHIRVTHDDNNILNSIVKYIYERSSRYYACMEHSSKLHVHIACELKDITIHTLKQNCKKKWNFLDKTTWSVKVMRKSFDTNCCYMSKLKCKETDLIYIDYVKGCNKTPDEYHNLYWTNNKKVNSTNKTKSDNSKIKPTEFNSYVLEMIHKEYPNKIWRLTQEDLNFIGRIYCRCSAQGVKMMGVNRYKETCLGILNHLCDDNSVQMWLQNSAFEFSGIPLC